MSDIKISAMPSAATLTGAELTLVDQGGVTVQTTSQAVANLAFKGAYTVATLPTGSVGLRAYVTDALTPTYGATAAGGGAVTVPVFYNGTHWITA